MVIRSKFHAEDLQIFGTMIQNFVAWAKLCPGLEYSCINGFSNG